MVSPAAKLADSEFVAAAPDNSVAPVTGAAALLLTTLPVAVPSVLKKLSPAVTADAATSEVLASVPIAVFKAAFRLDVVAAGVVPMAKLLVGNGVALDAVSWTDSVVPSGRLKVNLIWSPEFGLPAVRSIETAGGEPPGPVTVALVSDEETEFSLRPNGEPATSSATWI